VGVRRTETALVVWSAKAQPVQAAAATASPAAPDPDSPTIFGADLFYDAGDQGCAGGPLEEIARMLRRLQSGQTLEVRATDPGVAVDLPAWCRMTGHTLVDQRADRYLIRRK
jgi:tRNA 2-thiouridine synthesizing protein A